MTPEPELGSRSHGSGCFPNPVRHLTNVVGVRAWTDHHPRAVILRELGKHRLLVHRSNADMRLAVSWFPKMNSARFQLQVGRFVEHLVKVHPFLPRMPLVGVIEI